MAEEAANPVEQKAPAATTDAGAPAAEAAAPAADAKPADDAQPAAAEKDKEEDKPAATEGKHGLTDPRRVAPPAPACNATPEPVLTIASRALHQTPRPRSPLPTRMLT